MARKRQLGAPIVLALLAALIIPVVPGTSSAGINQLSSRFVAAGNLWRVTETVAKVRDRCGQDIETGDLPWTVDCSEDPASLGGAGTGNPEVDADLVSAYQRQSGRYLRLRNSGDPFAHGVQTLCSPSSSLWGDIDQCAFQISSDASKALFNLRFNPASRTVGTAERTCRKKLGRKLPGTYRKLIRHRARCFRRSGLLEGGAFAETYDCRAPAVPPGLGRPISGLYSLDKRVEKVRIRARSTVFNYCPDYLEGAGYPGANITDPTGGIFGRPDLVQVHLDTIVAQVDIALDALYPGVRRCGDGVTDAITGETCDDSNVISCDGCDSNCTTQACGNGIGCGGGEECDDGDGDSEDGCTPACVLEYCGDGVIQAGMEETCDDGDFDDDDGCDSNCLPTGCGNGIITGTEECDKGANNSDIEPNACRTNCTLARCGDGVTDGGEDCDGSGESATCNDDCTDAVCGDDIINAAAGETCDDANDNNNDDCPDGDGGTCVDAECGDGFIEQFIDFCDDGNTDDLDGCDDFCDPEVGWDCDTADPTVCTEICGDAYIVGGEDCYDGNSDNGDGCDNNCTFTGCGNGIITAGETCDDGNEDNTDACPDGPAGTCEPAVCGDGHPQIGVEECDHSGESIICDPDCTLAICGDGTLNTTAGEVCDDGVNNSDTEPDACRENCTFSSCGDGIIDGGAGETCDDGNQDNTDACPDGVGGTCAAAFCGDGHPETGSEECDHAGESAVCDPDCTGAVCGDSYVNVTAFEVCDEGGETFDCDDDCTDVECGDGNTNEADLEECDDGNTADFDGCDEFCLIE